MKKYINIKILFLTINYIIFIKLIKKYIIMKDLLWLIAVILIILWLVGYLGFGAAVGNFIHILLVLAVIMILYRLITGKKP